MENYSFKKFLDEIFFFKLVQWEIFNFDYKTMSIVYSVQEV